MIHRSLPTAGVLVALCSLLIACGAPAALPPTPVPPTSTPVPTSTPEPQADTEQGQISLVFKSLTEPYPPSARIYLIKVDGSGFVTAEMPEQPAGTSFTISAPPGFYYVYARSTRFEDISFFALWDAEVVELPALAQIDIVAGRTSGPFDLQRSPDFCGDRYILPESPDGLFPATNIPEYRQQLGCP